MKYLPILQELFDSDSTIFLLIGFTVALIAGFLSKENSARMNGLITSLVVYVLCEGVSNIRTNNFLEIALLLVGTTALGSFFGCLLTVVRSKTRWK